MVEIYVGQVTFMTHCLVMVKSRYNIIMPFRKEDKEPCLGK